MGSSPDTLEQGTKAPDAQTGPCDELETNSVTHLSHSVDHWQVSQAHGPEQVEDL